MCIACAYQPYDVLKTAREVAKERYNEERANLLHEAAMLKELVKTMDNISKGSYCDDGKLALDVIKNRQYELARKF